MSSAIILPIFYDRRSRRPNRRELFVKRITSGCVVIATLFIVVGLSSATWYMTILGTFILMVVGLSGFFKYCDRTPDSRAVRRAISISSRISTTTRPSARRSRSVATVGETSSTDIDLPPAYDNIVFDEPYSLGRASYHIRSFDHSSSPPPPYEAIFNVAANRSAGHSRPNPEVPEYTTITHQSMSTLVMPRLSLNHGDMQAVDLSHAITITESSHFTPRTMTSDTPRTVAQDVSQTVAPELPQRVATEMPGTLAFETPGTLASDRQTRQTLATETPETLTSETCQTIATEAPAQARVSEAPQTNAEETSETILTEVPVPQIDAQDSDSRTNEGASNGHARGAPNCCRGNDRMPDQSVSTAL